MKTLTSAVTVPRERWVGLPQGTSARSTKMPRPRVLYIDSDPTTLEAIAPVLREVFAVWVARSTEAALAVGAEIGYSADVVVICLASGMIFRGDSFIAEYRRRAHREVPVIIASGLAYELAKSIRSATVAAMPIDVLELVRAIHVVGQPERSTTTSTAGGAA